MMTLFHSIESSMDMRDATFSLFVLAKAVMLVRYARLSVHFPAAKPPPGAVTNSLASLNFYQVRYNHSAWKYHPPLMDFLYRLCGLAISRKVLQPAFTCLLSLSLFLSYHLSPSNTRACLGVWGGEHDSSTGSYHLACLRACKVQWRTMKENQGVGGHVFS